MESVGKSNREIVVVVTMFLSVCLVCYCDGSVIVSKDGNGDYKSVSEAIKNAPKLSESVYTIHVRAGTYEEYVVIHHDKTNIKLVGDGPRHTKLVAYQGSTIDIHGEGFMAESIAFVNSAGLKASGAVAVRNEANNTVFYRCSIDGYQDTLWAVSGRQFYKNCDIYGTVDFIYGAAAAVFQDCMLYARYRDHVTFTAQSRDDPNDNNSAFTFQRCNFTMSPEDSISHAKSEVHATLGRPWRPYSTVAILQCFIDSIVGPAGWEEMPGQPTDRVTYVEYGNVGPGAGTDGRVKWPGVRVLHRPAEAQRFTASHLLDADSWIPSTGVPYDNGF
ncbi:hypothetical protein HN51_000253 [Arachis hypogaea]|uniref:pectinesterase n=2 Tax=Arachis TaxID=3817 RepID=A0A445EWN3_ARAHY|nr:probable pectinesterase/pectinesterase inhibitor 39 [Arachis duranensis]XP_025689101.1 probable pectinesterase/pectinesterase inhibitor 39 [Arachis hypogaea]XP_057726388.1 probable pectinesterase/pectinesterase inhibitor 39 [Arachis stenosperma]QHO48082.1 putative pectinesterase/pectinesterase inhibitor [Arachis hypogaea]RYR79822.1 hypothetical protein Ahy_A01g004627 [Arachis hypogaea]